ncbi:hypothetical protein STENM327S_06755 [Streptomyces tendae]
MMVNLLFAVFGGDDQRLGFRSGALGVVFGIVGIILGACFLALDFKQVEDGLAYGAPREEAWFAAFGLTLTLVWIYLEFLRHALSRRRRPADRPARRARGPSRRWPAPAPADGGRPFSARPRDDRLAWRRGRDLGGDVPTVSPARDSAGSLA